MTRSGCQQTNEWPEWLKTRKEPLANYRQRLNKRGYTGKVLTPIVKDTTRGSEYHEAPPKEQENAGARLPQAVETKNILRIVADRRGCSLPDLI